MKHLSAVLVFVLVFGVIYFLFSGGIDRIKTLTETNKKDNTITVSQLMDKLAEKSFGIDPYWLKRYGISVHSLDDIKKDADNDGLTLEQEYLYLTNPFNADTDGDGYKDGEEVANGNSPIGDGKLDQVALSNFKDKESLSVNIDDKYRNEDDLDNDGLTNEVELAYGTDTKKADTDGDGYTDKQEIENGYDPATSGDARPDVKIKINKLGVEAPVVLSNDATETALQKDLEKGVIHYPKTAMPGQRGNVYIAGHSNYYAWSTGSYNNIFKNLNNLASGDTINLSVVEKTGKTIEYTYKVKEVLEVNADDARIFENTSSQVLTLTTCWPIGTSKRRIMVKAFLVS